MEEQLSLAQSKGITVVGVSHQNLFIHNNRFQFGYQIIGADALIALYEKYDVKLNLSGHLHLQSIVEKGNITEIAIASMAITPNQFAVLKVGTDLSMRYTTVPVNVENWARAEKIKDANLLNFSEYSKNFFDRVTELKFAPTLSKLNLDENIKALLMSHAVKLNKAYFTGTLTNADAYEEGLQLWEQYASDASLLRYFKSMKQDAEDLRDMNNWTLQAE